MSPEPGGQIGPYIITREIGRGGMGVVYLARDTKLDREVAIKCMPDELAEDPDRLARFEREAKALASLNHPNIASIYGLEEVDGKRYLVLEYVPGETLDAVLNHGPMPVSEALPIARQIAEAIEAAHEAGIIHRDLKPANIKFAEGDQVKVLDFGLAKAFEEKTSIASDIAASPTYIPTNTPTMLGIVLGTAGYLSPEQARGRQVDKRSDIFSFGCVLYEMLAGKTIFPGETVTDSLGATLHKEPVWDDLPPDTPPTILLLLRRCLTKDRKRRLHDIADARVEIEDAISDPTSSSLSLASSALAAAGAPGARKSRLNIAMISLVVGVLVTAVAFMLPQLLAPDEAPPPITRLSLNVPYQAINFGQRVAVSPDGRTMAVRGLDNDDEGWVFVRHLGQSELTPLEGLDNPMSFAFSPDGQWVAGLTREGLRRISIDGGPSTTLCEASFGMGIWWAPDGWIYFAEIPTRRILRVPENGGDPEVVVELEAQDDKSRHYLSAPQVLPDGSTLLCTFVPDSADDQSEIRAYSLVDSSMKTIVENASQSHYTSTGHLVFLRGSNLMAAPFDVEAIELSGPAVSLVEEITTISITRNGVFAIAENGTLFHSSGHRVEEVENIVALDAEGKRSLLVSFARENFTELRSSPDGSHLAVTVMDLDEDFAQNIWLVDVTRDIPALLTPEPGDQSNPLWSPDGRWIYYLRRPGRNDDVKQGVYRRRADFGGEAELVYETELSLTLACFNPEGTRIFVVDREDREQTDLRLIELEDEVALEPWLATPALETEISVSPNGRWAAYLSDETGNMELYVRSITGEQKQRISTEGAFRAPFWSPDGSTLYYQAWNGQGHALNAIRVTSGSGIAEDGVEPSDDPFDWEAAAILFVPGVDDRTVHMHPDGQRFIMTGSLEETETVKSFEIQVTLNFFEELKQRASKEF